MASTTRATRSITWAKPTCALAWIPNSRARAMSAFRRAARISALLGTQPVFRQSPPMVSRSISATRARVAAPIYALTRPADPAPITTRLYSNLAGRGHPA